MNSAINDTFVTVQIPANVYADLLSLKTDELKEPAEVIRHLTEEALNHAERNKKGLVSVIGKWEGFEEIETVLSDLQLIRQGGGIGRDVSF